MATNLVQNRFIVNDYFATVAKKTHFAGNHRLRSQEGGWWERPPKQLGGLFLAKENSLLKTLIVCRSYTQSVAE
jgi:hypothetical protein